jgi:hypothetical protein
VLDCGASQDRAPNMVVPFLKFPPMNFPAQLTALLPKTRSSE